MLKEIYLCWKIINRLSTKSKTCSYELQWREIKFCRSAFSSHLINLHVGLCCVCFVELCKWVKHPWSYIAFPFIVITLPLSLYRLDLVMFCRFWKFWMTLMNFSMTHLVIFFFFSLHSSGVWTFMRDHIRPFIPISRFLLNPEFRRSNS